ncbi:disease resistance protein RPS5-like [Prosopis cineraria]|uniref:disease resistance protein RPS5-like n=1 Tax=Prosopis cineraria TaxID=364024 RepID=UPI00240F7106|nr:disease resistance protein RPS5-like [Prosopis cineraria]
MAKSDIDLIEIPKDDEWHENLHKVFLRGNKIQKIVDGTSPKCSKLSTLLLDRNYHLKWIADDFFNNMPSLKVLDLSESGIERLLESVSNLECLSTLLISGCSKLSYVPSLIKLQRLISLDLSYTLITEAPCGLELLVNHRRLNFDSKFYLEMSASGIPKMTNLQSLVLNRIPKLVDVRAKDLQGLRKLEVISANFSDTEDFNACVMSFQDKDRTLKNYYLSSVMLLNDYVDEFFPWDAYSLKRVIFCGIDMGNIAMLPGDINELIITVYHYLEDLNPIAGPFAPSFHKCTPFSHLIKLIIHESGRMRILMTWELLSMLQNLEDIFVKYCKSMEEIVGEDCSSDIIPPTIITLPKLRFVDLYELPKLNSVFRGTMFYPSLESFHAIYCKKPSHPLIEIKEGEELSMKKTKTGYCWSSDDQVHISSKS